MRSYLSSRSMTTSCRCCQGCWTTHCYCGCPLGGTAWITTLHFALPFADMENYLPKRNLCYLPLTGIYSFGGLLNWFVHTPFAVANRLGHLFVFLSSLVKKNPTGHCLFILYSFNPTDWKKPGGFYISKHLLFWWFHPTCKLFRNQFYSSIYGNKPF